VESPVSQIKPPNHNRGLNRPIDVAIVGRRTPIRRKWLAIRFSSVARLAGLSGAAAVITSASWWSVREKGKVTLRRPV
jgi:hypothetical protein